MTRTLPLGLTQAVQMTLEQIRPLGSQSVDLLAATDRILADARLTRPIKVASVRKSAEFATARGTTRSIKGEPRLRLRGRLPGGWGLVRTERGELVPEFVADPSEAVQMLAPRQIRILQSDRDSFMDGFITY